MPRLVNQVPKLRKHASGQAFVVLNGRHVYLGKFGTAAAKEAYERTAGEWITSGRRSASPDCKRVVEAAQEGSGVSIVELCAAFLRHARTHYVKNGRQTDEVAGYKAVIGRLKALYGHTSAEKFGPKCLKAVRTKMISDGGSRRYVNQQVGRIKHMFKWAVAEEMVDAPVYQRLCAVSGLQEGKTEARETASYNECCFT